MDLAHIRYSRALFNLAIEKNELDKYKLSQESLSAILNQNYDFLNILSNPTISKKEKINLTQNILKDNFQDDFIGLILLLIKRNRESILPKLLEDFHELYLDYKKIAYANLYSSAPLADEKIAIIRNIVSKKLGKIIEIENIIDSNIISGFIIEVDGFLFDASVKTGINNIKNKLLSINI